MRSKKPQKAGSDSYSRYAKSQVCMTIKIYQARSCIYSRVLFTTFLASHKLSYLLSNTARSRKELLQEAASSSTDAKLHDPGLWGIH